MNRLLYRATHMLSCKEVSKLNSQRFDRQLGLRERFQIYLHLRVCDACAGVLKQLRFMRQAMQQYSAGPPVSKGRAR